MHYCLFNHLCDIMPTGSVRDIGNGLRKTYPYIKLLCMAVAAFCGLFAGLRVYSLWNIHGKHHIHIDAQVIAWISAAIFLMVAAATIEDLFPQL